jgi:RNA 3'-terminal phosphate cyclase
MSKTQTFILETKTSQSGVRGERVNKVVAESLTEAITMFAAIKQLREDQLLQLFSVYEQPTDGK